MNIPMRQRLAAALLLTALTASVAACGDDDSNAVAAPQGGDAGAETTPACDAGLDLASVFAGPPSDDMAGWVESTLIPAAETLATDLDEPDAAAAEDLIDVFGELAETGDMALLESTDVADAMGQIGAHIHDNCEFEQVDLEAYEYNYEGLPAEIDAGVVSFALTNHGVEDHEIVIFRRADDATETLDELLQLPEEEGMAKMQFTGVAFGGPGTTTYTAVDLSPGTYFVVCFIPMGGGEDGPPHFMEGMSGTFEVV